MRKTPRRRPGRSRPRAPSTTEGVLSPSELKKAYAEAHAPDAPWCHHSPTRCPACGADLAEELECRRHGHGALWRGTLQFLERHEPRAYRRLLVAWARHGLVGETFRARRLETDDEIRRGGFTDKEQQARREYEKRRDAEEPAFDSLGRKLLSQDKRFLVRQVPCPPAGPASILPPTNALLDKYLAFAEDERPVPRSGIRKPMSPAALVFQTFDVARAHLRRQPVAGKRLDDRALELIKERLFADDYEVESLRKLMQRGRKEAKGRDPLPSYWVEAILGLPLT
jgi:hypothetical protein